MSLAFLRVLKLVIISSLFSLLFTSCAYKNPINGSNNFHSLVSKLVDDSANKIKKNLQADDVVLVSATVNVYLKYVAESLGLDLICTETEIINNHYTGRYSSADCSAQQKAIRVLEKYQLSQYQHIYAYGNSDEDLAMLNLADYSYYVGKSTQLPILEKAEQLA